MASVEECRSAVAQLATSLAIADESSKTGFVDRTLSLHVPDLGITFTGRLKNGALEDIREDVQESAQIRFTIASDDLLALTRGELALAPAWLSGRIKVEAGLRDLLRLRSFL